MIWWNRWPRLSKQRIASLRREKRKISHGASIAAVILQNPLDRELPSNRNLLIHHRRRNWRRRNRNTARTAFADIVPLPHHDLRRNPNLPLLFLVSDHHRSCPPPPDDDAKREEQKENQRLDDRHEAFELSHREKCPDATAGSWC